MKKLTVVSMLAVATIAVAQSTEQPTPTEYLENANPPAAGTVTGSAKGRVVFDHVDFAYVEGQPVLDDVSFVAEPGQMIGLVGPTGAGKSTIINVLNRFYDISSGSVTIDGNDIRDVTKDSLRGQLGIVLQRTYLFTDTVRQNIRFGRLDATDDEVWERIARIGPRLTGIFEESVSSGRPTNVVADEMAREIIAAG